MVSVPAKGGEGLYVKKKIGAYKIFVWAFSKKIFWQHWFLLENSAFNYPIHLFGEISRRGEISLKMTNIALVRALRILNHIFTKTFYIGKCKKIFSKN